MNRLLIFFILCFVAGVNYPYVYAYDLDVSVNNEIEQKYDSDKLNKDMGIGSTTNTSKKTSKKAPKSTPSFDNSQPTVTSSGKNTNSNIKAGTQISAGTLFTVKSSTGVSGSSATGTILNFSSTSSVYKNGITFPAGTVFKGVVQDSHGGQIAGNGGLLEIKIVSMIYNNQTYDIEGKVTKANSKNVFLNKIKGKRQYVDGVVKQVKNGVNIYKKVQNISSKLPNNPLGQVVKPIPTTVGATGTLVYSALSPIIAVAQKGQNISLPAGTTFEIKITKDFYVY